VDYLLVEADMTLMRYRRELLSDSISALFAGVPGRRGRS
jgi:hypothetical protein